MKIFISHSSKNKEIVLKFAEFLENVSTSIEVFCSSEKRAINIEQIVLGNFRKVTAFARSEPDKFYEIAMSKGKAEAAKIEKESVRQQSEIETRLKKLDSIIRCLYEDRVVGRITPERYDEMVVG